MLARNPDYFEPGLPKLAGVELRIIPEMSVKIAALQAGDIDIVWDLPLDQVKALSGNAAGCASTACRPHRGTRAVMNNLIPPFNDQRVRQAFHLGVDKADVVELTLFGQGVATISPIPPSHPFYAKDVVDPARPIPAAARKLLAEAGYPNGIKIPIIVPVGRAGARAAGRHAAAARQAGRLRSAGAARALFSLDAEVSGQGAALYRRLFRAPDHRHQHLPVPAQQAEAGTSGCGTTATPPWTRRWSRRG